MCNISANCWLDIVPLLIASPGVLKPVDLFAFIAADFIKYC